MTYPLYIFFGLAPSIIWLLFYLRKDVHPEPNSQVIKIFFYGMLAAIPAVFLEKGFQAVLTDFSIPAEGRWVGFSLSPVLIIILNTLIGVALIEEVLKYLTVKTKVLKSAEFDEPTDALLYMIIAALGFAALENILILIPLGPTFLLGEAFSITAARFLGATFLHTLCSGTVGFFLALSFFERKNRLKFLAAGLGIATILHGLYNFSIMEIEGNLKALIPIIILISLALFVSLGFKRLKKMKSICKIS
jgi:RsiW-degrading membrane proteinase PrsW (M82 family)